MAYQPIENYGVIGNMRTAALIAVDGSIDWFCFPHFDSPSVFAAILDDKKGGRFQLTSTHEDAHTIHTRTYSTTRYWDNLGFNTHYESDCYSS